MNNFVKSPQYMQGAAIGPGEGEAAIIALLTPQMPALDLSRLGLTAIPSEVFWHSDYLLELDISWNALPELPDALVACSSLRRLDMNMTSQTRLPSVVTKLRRLEILQLHDNAISELPASISALFRLKLLVVSENQLSQLPDSISGVSCLSTGSHKDMEM
jgi:internalin A